MEKGQNINFKTIVYDFLYAINLNRGLIPTCRDLLLRPNLVIQHYFNRNKMSELERQKYFSFGRFFVAMLAILGLMSFFYGSNILNISNTQPVTSLDIWIHEWEEKYAFISALVFGVIPMSICMKLVFLKFKKYNFPSHIIIQCYLYPFSLLLTIPFCVFFGDYLGSDLGLVFSSMFIAFSSNMRRKNFQNAKINLDSKHHSLEHIKATIKTALITAYYNYSEGLKNLELLAKNLETIETTASLNKELYDMGQISNLEYRESQILLDQTRINYSLKLSSIEMQKYIIYQLSGQLQSK